MMMVLFAASLVPDDYLLNVIGLLVDNPLKWPANNTLVFLPYNTLIGCVLFATVLGLCNVYTVPIDVKFGP
jgi:hypothetical protein